MALSQTSAIWKSSHREGSTSLSGREPIRLAPDAVISPALDGSASSGELSLSCIRLAARGLQACKALSIDFRGTVPRSREIKQGRGSVGSNVKGSV